MTLNDWVKWSFRQHRSWHPYPSTALARQAARDLGVPVTHEEFNAAMQAAGFKIVRHSGNVVFFGARDTGAKRRYLRQRYLCADETVTHPLLERTRRPVTVS
jgi:hypothetical protein